MNQSEGKELLLEEVKEEDTPQGTSTEAFVNEVKEAAALEDKSKEV